MLDLLKSGPSIKRSPFPSEEISESPANQLRPDKGLPKVETLAYHALCVFNPVEQRLQLRVP